MQILRGAPVAAAITASIKESINSNPGLCKKRRPCLAIVRTGENKEDLSYERSAIKRISGAGMEAKVFAFPRDISMESFMKVFAAINTNPDIDGILLFRPLPPQLDEAVIADFIDPAKDVDGISSLSLAGIFKGSARRPEKGALSTDSTAAGFAPSTAQAVMELLHYYGITLEGKHVAVIGRSLVVGKPLSMLLLSENATVTMCHSHTKDVQKICSQADIVVCAAGNAKWVDQSFIADGAVVIDVGINMDTDGKLCGDADFESISKKASMATPVPGGIGAVTTAVLAKHVFEAAVARLVK